ncbi:MAG: hypothetical protein QW429_05415 [Thermoprotei archaeon]
MDWGVVGGLEGIKMMDDEGINTELPVVLFVFTEGGIFLAYG